MVETWTPEQYRAHHARKRRRQPQQVLPDVMTGDELRKHLEPGTLEQQCRDAGLPVPETEVYFHPTRKWRFDFAWPDLMVAVEIDGGIWMDDGRGGRHNRGEGLLLDYEKLNAAAVAGWCVLRFTTDQVKTRVAINELKDVLERRMDSVSHEKGP